MNKIDEAKKSPSGVECEMDAFHVPNALFQERLAFLGSKSEMDHYAKMCHALALCLRGNVGSKVFVDNVFLLTKKWRTTRRKTPWNINSSLVATMPWRVTGFIASHDWFHANGWQSYRLPAFVCFRHVGVRILDLKLRVTIQQREIPRIHWWKEIQMSWTWVWLIPGFTELKLYLLWKNYLLVVKQYQFVLGVENCPILLCLALLPCIFLGQEA